MAIVHDDPDTPPTAYVSAAFVIILIVAVYALQGYYSRVQGEVDQEKVVLRTSEELANHQAEQQLLLHRLEWADQDAGRVTIPVERAMDLVAAELATNGGAVTNP